MLRLSNINLFNPLVYAVASGENNKIFKNCKQCIKYKGKININIYSTSHLSINFQLI